MDVGSATFRFDPVLIHQVPFCPPFWSAVTNLTGPSLIMTSLWTQLPEECRTANTVVATIACLISVVCVFIHLTTIVAYSSMRGDILERKRNAGRRVEKRRKADLSIIRQAADYAFAMKTQERLRMAFAISGIVSSGLLLPVAVASAGVAYSQPFPQSVLNPEKSWSELHSYSLAIVTLFHLTLTASLSTLLLMVVERLRETFRICPDHYIKSANTDVGKAYPRDSLDFERSLERPDANHSAHGKYDDQKRSSEILRKRETNILNRVEDTFIYAFRQSYTFLDLVMTFLVPAISGIVTTLALAVFGARFEPFGLIETGSRRPGRMASISGLISYKSGSYPDSVYVYSATVGVIIVAIIFGNFLSMLRCHTLMSIARYLPGYQHSRDLFKFGEGKKSGQKRRPRSVSRIAPDSVRLSRRRMWSRKSHRQDPDGLSIDNSNDPEFESSISSIPPPPPPPARYSVMSVDTMSLPPPPRPESMIDIQSPPSVFAFPSLPSVVRYEDPIESEEPPDEEITAIKADAFFGNIRQSKVVIAIFVLFIMLSTPLLVLFAAGVFYPHDGRLLSIMGGAVNITDAPNKVEDRAEVPLNVDIEGSVYVEPTPPDYFTESTTNSKSYENALNELVAVVNQRNWVTSLSAVFLILYALASVSPFFAYCVVSRKFRSEASRFFFFCLCFQWGRYRKPSKRKRNEEIVRSRSNRSVTLSASNSVRSRSFHNVNDLRGGRHLSSLTREIRHSMKAPRIIYQDRTPLRREKTFAATRNVSWELPDNYGGSRM